MIFYLTDSLRGDSEYLESIEIEKGLSKNTIEAYGRDIESFIEFIQNKDINENTQIDGAPPITPNTIGTLRIYDDSTDKNWYIGFIPDPEGAQNKEKTK